MGTTRRFLNHWGPLGLAVAIVLLVGSRAQGADGPAVARYREAVQPVLADNCYGCHADGLKKGGVAFDGFPSDDALVQDRALWFSVLKNVRAGVMPPAGKPRPTAEEVRMLADWIKYGVLGIDPNDPDPGRVTIRRLNRVEYRNTIRDLMGIDFRTDEEFPPDDTGYGFDTIGDVLTVSPLLLEKYVQAAETIVAEAVPSTAKIMPTRTIYGVEFRGTDASGERMPISKPARIAHDCKVEQEGTYQVVVNLNVRGAFEFNPARCKLTFKIEDRELLAKEFGWEDGKKHKFVFAEEWSPGAHPLTFELQPLTSPDETPKKSSVDLRINSVVIEGPMEQKYWKRPKNFERFFGKGDPGPGPERRPYVQEILHRFATQAFRRPVDDRTVDRLTALVEATADQPGQSVEQGLTRAMVAVLASPRFLFRVEEGDPAEADRPYQHVDEYALAARLSYLLWSTTPDDELIRLAERGELRKELPAQVKRMLADSRSDMLVRNFTGQWLQARDVAGTAIDARSVLARDAGEEKELKRQVEEFKARQAARAAALARGETPPRVPFQRPKFFNPSVELDGPLRDAMRRETEMFFSAVVHEDRSVLDLIDSDSTFLNERLAKHYGVPDVKGESMRRVSLPPDSPRGGVLTQGSVLVVTSNPTRTSPVKRGLFILENILGTPPPPPPADVPPLEDAEKAFPEREPSLRELMELHRSKALCNSCHSRMDPLGLALENFNAMGMWRDQERNQPLDAAGTLITGEKFTGIRDLKRVLKEYHRLDFYRCLTEKLLIYALGRGLEHADVETVDRIVDRLDGDQGRFSALLLGVIESAPFQKRRNVSAGGSEPRDQTGTTP